MEVDTLRVGIQVVHPSLLRWVEENQAMMPPTETGMIWRECPCDWLGAYRVDCPPEHHVVDCPYKCFITLSEYLKHYLAIQELGWSCSCPDCMYMRELQNEGQIDRRAYLHGDFFQWTERRREELLQWDRERQRELRLERQMREKRGPVIAVSPALEVVWSVSKA